MTVPNKTAFGDYTLESSWGYIGHNILTQCYAGGCENSTLTTVTPNHIEFTDNHGDTIHLMRLPPPQPSTPVKTVTAKTGILQKTVKGPGNITATVTAPPGSTLNSLSVTVFTPAHLDGTWNFVNSGSNASGTITFGTSVLPIKPIASNERIYGFSGIFDGQPVSGTYTYSLGGGPTRDWFSLDYTYHHHKVEVMGNLNRINPAHIEMTNVYSFYQYGAIIGSDYRIATGLHLHYGDIIHLMRALKDSHGDTHPFAKVVKTLVPITSSGEYLTADSNTL
jgi:hypothetical protein